MSSARVEGVLGISTLYFAGWEVKKKKCPRRESNAQPSAPQAGALSIKLRGRFYQDAYSNPYSNPGQGKRISSTKMLLKCYR